MNTRQRVRNSITEIQDAEKELLAISALLNQNPSTEVSAAGKDPFDVVFKRAQRLRKDVVTLSEQLKYHFRE